MDNKEALTPNPKPQEFKQNWQWTDDLSHLVWGTIIPLALMLTFIFGGHVGLSTEERMTIGSFAIGLKTNEPKKKD